MKTWNEIIKMIDCAIKPIFSSINLSLTAAVAVVVVVCCLLRWRFIYFIDSIGIEWKREWRKIIIKWDQVYKQALDGELNHFMPKSIHLR
jgi:hypothetical protein